MLPRQGRLWAESGMAAFGLLPGKADADLATLALQLSDPELTFANCNIATTRCLEPARDHCPTDGARRHLVAAGSYDFRSGLLGAQR